MKIKNKGILMAAAVSGLLIAGASHAENQKQESSQETQEAKICCEVQDGCGGKDGCGSKKVVKVKSANECTSQKGKVIECSK